MACKEDVHSQKIEIDSIWCVQPKSFPWFYRNNVALSRQTVAYGQIRFQMCTTIRMFNICCIFHKKTHPNRAYANRLCWLISFWPMIFCETTFALEAKTQLYWENLDHKKTLIKYWRIRIYRSQTWLSIWFAMDA